MSIISEIIGDDPGGKAVMAEVPVMLAPRRRNGRLLSPQQSIDEFWSKFTTKAPGKATAIMPQNEWAERAARRSSSLATGGGQTAQASYEDAAATCREKVAQIVRECRRVNQKYRDPHFDLEADLKLCRRDCLESLNNLRDQDKKEPDNRDKIGGDDNNNNNPNNTSNPAESKQLLGRRLDGDVDSSFRPQAVKRVVDIFDNPQFYIDGPTANDVRQGRDGDCWLMAALCTMSNKPGLIERICVAHDQDVGVYGFVFHRDGEWFSEIIDDKLYLTKPDYDEGFLERILWEDRERVNSEEAYRKIYQSNSGALYFAQCENPNETWLPLLEKAYAKAHGDYAAIEGGFTGEGIEDLTGGVTSEIYTTDILDKEYFWREELLKVNETFLFGCSTGVWGCGWGERKGIVELHAYSVMRAVEVDGVRLVLLKNPWGKHEWKGPWSDGSREWTPEWLRKLNHRFGDDGSFWISYEDLLRKYQAFDRTRLFGADWKVANIWTTMTVPWTLEYNQTKFSLRLSRPGPVVLVLSQLDDRYFRGLEGQYHFELSFRVHAADRAPDDYLVRSQATYRMNRSVSVELDLDAGDYTVLVKIDAQRNDNIMPPEDVVRASAKTRREKLIRIGLAYDLAHSKGRIAETAEEKAAREAAEKRRQRRHLRQLKERIMEDRRKNYYLDVKHLAKKRKRAEKLRAKKAARAEKRRAEAEARRKEMEEAEAKEEEERLRLRQEQQKQHRRGRRGSSAAAVSRDRDGGGDKKEDEEGDKDKATGTEPTTKDPKNNDTPPSEKKGDDSNGEVKEDENKDKKDGVAKQDAPGDGESTTTTATGQDVNTPSVSVAGSEGSTTVLGANTSAEKKEKGQEDRATQTDEGVPEEKDADGKTPPHEPPAASPDDKDMGSPDKPSDSSEPTAGSHEATTEKPKEESSPPDTIPEAEAAESSGKTTADVGVQVPEDDNDTPYAQDDYYYYPHASRRWQQQPPPPPPGGKLHPPYHHYAHHHHHQQAYHTTHPHPYPVPPPPPPRRMPAPHPGGRSSSLSGPPRSSLVAVNNDSNSDGMLSDLDSVSSVSEISDREVEIQMEIMQRRRVSLAGGVVGGVIGAGGGPADVVGPSPPGGGGGGGRYRGGGGGRSSRSRTPLARGGIWDYDLEDEFERDPWNAVAVVGLRVYYKVSEEEAERERKRKEKKKAEKKEKKTGEKEKKKKKKEGDEKGEKDEKEEEDEEIIQLRVERKNPFAPDSDEDEDEDEDKTKEEKEAEGAEKKEAAGAKEEKVLDVDDSARDATVELAAEVEEEKEKEKEKEGEEDKGKDEKGQDKIGDDKEKKEEENKKDVGKDKEEDETKDDNKKGEEDGKVEQETKEKAREDGQDKKEGVTKEPEKDKEKEKDTTSEAGPGTPKKAKPGRQEEVEDGSSKA